MAGNSINPPDPAAAEIAAWNQKIKDRMAKHQQEATPTDAKPRKRRAKKEQAGGD